MADKEEKSFFDTLFKSKEEKKYKSKKKTKKPSIAEQINWGGQYRKKK